MKREFPNVNIEGTEFLFDIDEIVLIERTNPKNRIYFHSMKDCWDHYEFLYSAVTKKFHSEHSRNSCQVFGEPLVPRNDGPPIKVRIPSIGALDPSGMCRKYGCTQEDLIYKTDFEIMVNQTMFNKRVAGIPMTVDFPGRTFEVDVANNCLRPVDSIGDTLYLNGLYPFYSVEDDVYYLYYNMTECRFENPFLDGSWDRTPGRIVVEVPILSDLDPIGWNMAFGYAASYGLLYRDIQMSYTARVVPWEEHDIAIGNGMHPAFQHPVCRPGIRELPTIAIEGTDFLVDVNRFELRQKADERNIISFKDMYEVEGGYCFEYSRRTKNLPVPGEDGDVTVEIPEFVRLDPVGMGRKYGLAVDEVRSKTDFDLMVDQHAFDTRVNKGRLPTIEVAGQLFYVDIRLDKLRPKDDFLSDGISFHDIDHYYSDEAKAYTIPYNPKTKEFQELDCDNLTEFPKDLIAVQFPFQKELDPVGWNREGGWELKDDLKHIGVKQHFRAETIPWQQTFLPEIIRINEERNRKEQQKPMNTKCNGEKSKRNRGRKM